MERAHTDGFSKEIQGLKPAFSSLDETTNKSIQKIVEFKDTFESSTKPVKASDFDPAERARRRKKAKNAKLARRKNR